MPFHIVIPLRFTACRDHRHHISPPAGVMAGGSLRVATFGRRLRVHVHDLDAAIDRVGAVGGVLQLGLAITDRDEVGAVEAVILHQVLLDGVGAPFRESLIVLFGADRIGVAGDHEGRALQRRIGQCLAERLHRGHRGLGDVGRVVVELDFQIDVRLGRRELRDLIAFAHRQRTGLPVAHGVQEGRFLGLRRRIGLRTDGQAAGHGLRLQCIQDLAGRDVVVAGESQACRHRQRGRKGDRLQSKKLVEMGHCRILAVTPDGDLMLRA